MSSGFSAIPMVGKATLLILVLFAVSVGHALAVTKTSNGSGNWGAGGTWTPAGAPTAADDVIIAAGNTVTMNTAGGAALSLTINGTADWQQARTTNVGAGGVTISAGGDITGTVAGVLTSTGGLTINATTTSNTVIIIRQTTAGQNISGNGSLALLQVDATTTNIGTLTVRTALTGTSTLTNTGTLIIGGTSTITGLTANTAANTVNYNGAAQTVKLPSGTPATYFNLSLSVSGIKTMPGTAMTISNDFTTSGTISTTAAQALTVGRDLTIGSGTTFSGATFTHNVARDFSNSGTFTASTSTVTLNGTVVQAIGGTSTTTFNDLTVANITAAVFANTNFNTNGTLNMNGANTLLTPAAAVVAGGTGTLTGTGTVQVTRTAATPDFLTQYTITNKTLTNLTVEYSGAAAQTVSALTYGGLKINNSSGVTLAGNATVNNTLTFTAGNITTNAITLTIAASGSTLGAQGAPLPARHVIGNMEKVFSAIGSFTYTVGDGTNYAPLTLQFFTLPTPGNLTVSTPAAPADHPDTMAGTSLIRLAQSVNRYWTLKKNAALVGVFSASATYIAGDLDGPGPPAATFSNFSVSRGTTCTFSPGRTCASWAIQSLGANLVPPSPSATQITATAMQMTSGAAESDLAVGEPTLPRVRREKEFIFTRELY